MKSRNDNAERVRTSADAIREKLQDPRYGQEYVRGYLTAGFLRSAVDSLWRARRQADLTQEFVARQLHTKQPGVARMESDTTGSMPLRRYVEFALACGKVPLLMLAPIENVIEYILADPAAARTADAYMAWQLARVASLPAPGNTVRSEAGIKATVNSARTGSTGFTAQDSAHAVAEAERLANEPNRQSFHQQSLNQKALAPTQPVA